MVVKAKNKTPSVVTINREWQLAFVGVLILSQLVESSIMLWSLLHYSHHLKIQLWSFQIMQALYPLLFVVAAYVYSLKRVRGVLPRTFWATLIGTMGVVAYFSLQIPLNYLWNVLKIGPFTNTAYNSNGFYNWYWLQMGVIFTVYCLVLLGITWRGKRR